MHSAKHSIILRYTLILLWIIIMSVALYVYFFQRDFINAQLAGAFSVSVALGYLIYLILCSLRGFTLIPSTYTIILGLLFFRPGPLFILTILGIFASSSLIYFFSEALHLHEIFEKKYPHHVKKITNFLKRNELAVVIGWSFFPFVPTDIICYVCGILEVNYKKFIFGVLVGESITSGIYIFAGTSILSYFGLK